MSELDPIEDWDFCDEVKRQALRKEKKCGAMRRDVASMTGDERACAILDLAENLPPGVVGNQKAAEAILDRISELVGREVMAYECLGRLEALCDEAYNLGERAKVVN